VLGLVFATSNLDASPGGASGLRDSDHMEPDTDDLDTGSPNAASSLTIELMTVALDEARAAVDHDDVPVGAVIVHDGVVIARRHNERELTGDPVAHAEVLALRDAAAVLGQWRLDDCTMYVTLEPCVMCAGAMVNARLGRVVFGATDPKAGGVVSHFGVLGGAPLNHAVAVESGALADQCGQILRDFFRAKRR
jgi:tRNA(adenine34) deaminase